MKFLIDAQLPQIISDWLIEANFDSIHALQLPHKNHSQDSEICKIADDQNRIIVTKDSDFLDSNIIKGSPELLLIINTGNVKNRELMSYYEITLRKSLNYLKSIKSLK